LFGFSEILIEVAVMAFEDGVPVKAPGSTGLE